MGNERRNAAELRVLRWLIDGDHPVTVAAVTDCYLARDRGTWSAAGIDGARGAAVRMVDRLRANGLIADGEITALGWTLASEPTRDEERAG